MKAENDWWALGQHHGLATPLLDWTASPYVAAYFAFCNTNVDDTKKRVVFALAQNAVRTKGESLLQTPQAGTLTTHLEFFKPLSDENSRLVNQGGLFTRVPLGVDVEKWVKQHFSEEKRHWILIKLQIPSSNREQCLRELNRMNINHLTLFPDLYGASAFSNMTGAIKAY